MKELLPLPSSIIVAITSVSICHKLDYGTFWFFLPDRIKKTKSIEE